MRSVRNAYCRSVSISVPREASSCLIEDLLQSRLRSGEALEVAIELADLVLRRAFAAQLELGGVDGRRRFAEVGKLARHGRFGSHQAVHQAEAPVQQATAHGGCGHEVALAQAIYRGDRPMQLGASRFS